MTLPCTVYILRNDIHTYQVKLLLELLIGIVDAELLETVHPKHFEAIDIEHANEPALTLSVSQSPQSDADCVHDPRKNTRVEVLGESVSSTQCLQ